MLYTGWFWERTRPMNRTTWLLQESRFQMMISLTLLSMTVRKEVGSAYIVRLSLSSSIYKCPV